jgi:glycosyltransferase involved in cell wall biosynthesis
MEWLCRAQDASGVGGVSGGYSLLEGWYQPYSETTGYIIPTFLAYASISQEPDYVDRAVRMGDWEMSIQLPCGATPGGMGGGGQPLVFDTGQVISGWTALYRATGQPRFLDAAKRAADWVISAQDPDGKWTKYSLHGIPHAYYAMVDSALMGLYSATGDARYKTAAERNVAWILSKARPDGWIEHMSFSRDENPSMHTIAYTLQAVLECSPYLSGPLKELSVSVVRTASEKILACYEKACPGRTKLRQMPARLGSDWTGEYSYTCLVGDAQMCIVWLMIHQLTGDRRLLSAASRLLDQVKARQNLRSSAGGIRGGISGSYPIWGKYLPLAYVNWAAKFFADALMLEQTVHKSKTAKSPEKKSVLFVAYYYPPMGGAGVQRSAKFVKYLPEFGYRTVVLTAAPQSYLLHREFQFDQTVGDGLAKVDHEVVMVSDPEPRRPRRFMERMGFFPVFWFFFYPILWEPQLFWALAAIAPGLKLIRKKNLSAIYTTSGPYASVVTGVALKWITRKPWIADLRDPWTEDFKGVWPSPFHRWLERRFAKWVLRRADNVIANTPVARRMLLKLCGQDMSSRMPVVTNGYDEQDFTDIRTAPRKDGAFVIAHIGAFGTGRTPDDLRGFARLKDRFKIEPKGYDRTTYSARYFLKAVRLLLDHGQIPPGSFRAVLVGFVPEEAHEEVRTLGLENFVTFLGYRSHIEAVQDMMDADALWLPLPLPEKGRPLQRVAGKLYEYMRSGKPVLALVPAGDAKDFLRKSGLGFFAKADDPEDIARVLLNLYEQHRNGGIRVQPNWEFIRRFERKELTRQLGQILDAPRGAHDAESEMAQGAGVLLPI